MSRKLRFIDVYNAAKNDQQFDYVFWLHVILDLLSEYMLRYVSYILVTVAVSIIMIITLLGFFVVIPTIAEPCSIHMFIHITWGTLN
jgi:hypothetical protein